MSETTILRAMTGSHAYGTAIDGVSDHDEIGVFIPPVAQVLGLEQGREKYETNDHGGHRSGVGFTDVSMYSARKFAQLALEGRPSILVPLFVPDQAVTQTSPAGAALRSIRAAFLSVSAIERHISYAQAQHKLMMGGGSEAHGPLRPELIEQHGWDVKYGTHALRLAAAGLELATDATMTFPVRPSVASVLVAIRQGAFTRDEVSGRIGRLIAETRQVIASGPAVPVVPNVPLVQQWLIDTYQQEWTS